MIITWKQLLEYAATAGVKDDDVIDSMFWSAGDQLPGEEGVPVFAPSVRCTTLRPCTPECPSRGVVHSHWQVI